MRSQCLCQICTCGRHRCPHGATRIYEDSGVYHPTTEYAEKYPTYGSVLPARSLKPKQELRAYRGKMEGITTFKSDYRPHEIVQQSRHIPQGYKPQEGEIDLDTTYKRDFNSYPVQPVAIVRPLERPQVQTGKLDTVPTYKDDYRAWDVQRRELHRPEPMYHPPTVEFGTCTTFQDDYVPHELVPTESCKPARAPFQSPGPFEDVTVYATEFAPKKREVCPASFPAPPGYVYENTNSRGHRFFRKTTRAPQAC